MLNHSHFEEICAAASAGQASAQELLDLEQHAAECVTCRQAYSEYLGLAAQQFAGAAGTPKLSDEAAQECLESGLIAERFVRRAMQEGIVFSREATKDFQVSSAAPMALAPRPSWLRPLEAIAAVLLIGVSALVTFQLTKSGTKTSPSTEGIAKVVPAVRQPEPLTQRIAVLTEQSQALQSEVDRLESQLSATSEKLSSRDADLKASAEQQRKLAADRDSFQTRLEDVQQELADSNAQLASTRVELAKLPGSPDEISATLVANQATIHDLSTKLTDTSKALNQERQLLALGHDVRNLMAARNLHIVDVVDTDPRGRTQQAFGRIFFTEGKSLIFYAYDLNEAKIEKANYQYRIWAKKEGPDHQVKSLGIFYSDDKAQRRWVYKCNDPKILSEIDSVFVTLEPANSDPSGPKGPNLMYAYLRGQPNHP